MDENTEITPQTSDYPVNFDVQYPDRDLDRLSTAFRLILLLPIVAVLMVVSGGIYYSSSVASVGSGGFLFLGPLLMILFVNKYPRWWYDWNLQLARFSARVSIYGALMDDQYPSTDEEQSVKLDFPYPNVERDLNNFLPLVKWILAIPHYIVLIVLYIGAIFVVIFAWFSILISGRYPRGAFDYLVGVHRWGYRVYAYAFFLVTDKYPPFRLDP